MDSKTYVFSELKNKYAGFLNASALVYVSGKELGYGFKIEDITIENTVLTSESGVAYMKLRRNDSIVNSTDNENLLAAFPLMAKIKIAMGYQDQSETVFEGIIYERNFVLSSEYDTSVRVISVDNKALFRLNNTYSTYQNVKSYSGVVSLITSKYPVRTVIDKSKDFNAPMNLSQYGLSDFEYISKIASYIGYEFFALFENIYFRKARCIQAPLIKFEQKNLLRLEYRTGMNRILSEIRMLTHDQDKNESKTYTCDTVQSKVGNGLTGAEILKKNRISAVKYESCYGNKRISKDYAEQAASILQENSMETAELTFSTDGLPQMIPGRFVKLENVSKCVDNTYYIKKTVHTYRDNVYSTEVTCYSNTIPF